MIGKPFFVIYFSRQFGYHIMREQKYLWGVIHVITAYPHKFNSTFFNTYNEALAFLK